MKLTLLLFGFTCATAAAAPPITEPAPAPIPVSFVHDHDTIREGGSVLGILLKCAVPNPNPGIVQVAVTGGTAREGVDFQLSEKTIFFIANQQVGSVTITPLSDAVLEPDETIELSLVNATGGLSLGSITHFTVTIKDAPFDSFRIAYSVPLALEPD